MGSQTGQFIWFRQTADELPSVLVQKKKNNNKQITNKSYHCTITVAFQAMVVFAG